jgi:hypothetical protein
MVQSIDIFYVLCIVANGTKFEAQKCMRCSDCWAGYGGEFSAMAEAVLRVTFGAYYFYFNHR